jgi:hypothetical protein
MNIESFDFEYDKQFKNLQTGARVDRCGREIFSSLQNDFIFVWDWNKIFSVWQ